MFCKIIYIEFIQASNLFLGSRLFELLVTDTAYWANPRSSEMAKLFILILKDKSAFYNMKVMFTRWHISCTTAVTP